MKTSFWKKRKDNKVFSNYIYLLLIQGANFILPLIALPYLVITLGSEKYGLVMIAQSLAIFFTILVDFGFNISATREVAILKNDKEKLSQYFWNIYLIKIFLILITFLILLLLITFIDKFNTEPSVYICSFGLVIGQAIFPTWFFQGIEKMKMITIINVLAKVFFTISIFFFVLEPKNFEFVPILNGLGFIISGFIGFIYSLKYIKFISPKYNLIIKIIKESRSLVVSNFAVNFYTSSNILILGFFGGDVIAGVYASMEKLVVATKSIYWPLYQAMFPYLSSKPKIEIYKTIHKLIFPMFIIGSILSLFIIFGSEDILSFVYNKDVLIVSYYKVFQILGLIALLSALNMLFVTLLLPAIKAYKTRMKILSTCAIVHVFLVLFLTNWLSIYGVAIAAAITELLILIISYYYIKKLKIKRVFS
jgi:PST family polysaccharide transporter